MKASAPPKTKREATTRRRDHDTLVQAAAIARRYSRPMTAHKLDALAIEIQQSLQ